MGCLNSKKKSEDWNIDPKITENDIIPADARRMHATPSKPNQKITKEELYSGLKNKKFKKIAFLTGAGISVAAGIPDFRTPGTGLFHTVKDLGLPKPEALFDIRFFKEKPEKFYKFAKEFIKQTEVEPVCAHRFIVEADKRGLLMKSYTQNIDGLEIKAGVSREKVLEAHGGLGKAKCIKCFRECDINQFKKHVEEGKILKCDKCGGLVKPNIVFYHEPLNQDFFDAFDEISEADLVIVMGTSLKVSPFNMLLENVSCPIVVINRENPVSPNEKYVLFFEGDIETNIKEIAKNIGWEKILK